MGIKHENKFVIIAVGVYLVALRNMPVFQGGLVQTEIMIQLCSCKDHRHHYGCSRRHRRPQHFNT